MSCSIILILFLLIPSLFCAYSSLFSLSSTSVPPESPQETTNVIAHYLFSGSGNANDISNSGHDKVVHSATISLDGFDSAQPSSLPISQQSSIPSNQPSNNPSSQPSSISNSQPSSIQSSQPLIMPRDSLQAQPHGQSSGLANVWQCDMPSDCPDGFYVAGKDCDAVAETCLQCTYIFGTCFGRPQVNALAYSMELLFSIILLQWIARKTKNFDDMTFHIISVVYGMCVLFYGIYPNTFFSSNVFYKDLVWILSLLQVFRVISDCIWVLGWAVDLPLCALIQFIFLKVISEILRIAYFGTTLRFSLTSLSSSFAISMLGLFSKCMLCHIFIGKTLLIHAAMLDFVLIVNLCIKFGFQKDAKDRNGWTALMHASHNGHIEVVELLLSIGADKNTLDNIGRSAGDLAGCEQIRHILFFSVSPPSPVHSTTHWLMDRLISMGVSAEHILKCNKVLINEQGFNSEARFANLPPGVVNISWMRVIGIRELGTANALVNLHGALRIHYCLNIINLSSILLKILCIVCMIGCVWLYNL